MKKLELFVLLLILLGACVVRLYKFDSPLADWHSWRQVDTSSVSRHFVKYGFDVLRPTFDDLSSGVSLIDNPSGYRFVEFPIYNVLQAGLYVVFGNFTLEQWGRLVTIFSSLFSIIFLFLLCKKYISTRAGFIAALFYAFIPYNIYYSRVLLPDSSMVAALLGGIYFFDLWIEKGRYSYFLLALFFSAGTLLLKPFGIFFALPFAYLILRKFGVGFLTKPQIWIFITASILPLALWRLWMNQYPEGIPRNDWLFNGNNIRFKGAFFHWIFAVRISEFILGFYGLPFVILGILGKMKKEGLLFFSFLVSSLAYVTVLATGNVQHDYYQILIVPTLTLFFAKGVDFIFENSKDFLNQYVVYIVILVSILLMFAFSWFRIRDYYNIQHVEIVEAGIAADRLIPKNAKVIAPYNGDTTLLYYTNRKGWPVFDRQIKDFLKAGATHLVFANPGIEELRWGEFFEEVSITERYAIFDLTKPLPKSRLILK